jgi:CRP-like cAMP-binding protein
MLVDLDELGHHPAFRRLSRVKLSEGAAAFVPCEIGGGEVLIREGESDRAMILVLDGEFSVHVGEDLLELTQLGRGSLIGEMTLFGTLDRRSATVVSMRDSRILLLDAEGLKFLRMKRSPLLYPLETHAMQGVSTRVRQTNRLIASVALGGPLPEFEKPSMFGRIFRRAPSPPRPDLLAVLTESMVFRGLPGRLLRWLSEQLEPQLVPAGTVVLREGDAPGDAWLVASGCVDVFHTTLRETHERLTRLRDGHLFGVCGLLDGRKRAATCIATEPSWLVRVPASLLPGLEEQDAVLLNGMRRALFNSVAISLRQANSHAEYLRGKLNGHAVDPRFM